MIIDTPRPFTLLEKICRWVLNSPFGPRSIWRIKAYWNLRIYDRLIWYVISNQHPPFDVVVLPLIKEVYPSISIKDFVNVQPMTAEIDSQIFYLDFETEKSKS